MPRARPTSAAVTLMDLARATGFSHMTVQRALTGATSVRPETRAIVVEAATRLGYRVNASARAVRTGRFDQVALLTTDDWRRANLITMGVIDGALDVLAARDIQLVYERFAEATLVDDQALPQVLRKTTIDGVLIKYDNRIPARMHEVLERHRMPVVWLNVRLEHDSVHPDDVGLGRAATEHLLRLGHRRIAYVEFSYDPGDPGEHYSAADRAAGYAAAMAAAGCEPIVRRGRMDRSSRRAVLAALLDEGVTGLVGYSAEPLWQAVRLARERGMQLPRDLSLVSCDGGFTRYLETPLDHGVVDQRRLGRTAAERLLEKLDRKRRSVPSIAVPMRIEAEGSAVPPPG